MPLLKLDPTEMSRQEGRGVHGCLAILFTVVQ